MIANILPLISLRMQNPTKNVIIPSIFSSFGLYFPEEIFIRSGHSLFFSFHRFIQEQMPVSYQPLSDFYCTRARYKQVSDDEVEVYRKFEGGE